MIRKILIWGSLLLTVPAPPSLTQLVIQMARPPPPMEVVPFPLAKLVECRTLWDEPEWVNVQNVELEQLHAHDCYQNDWAWNLRPQYMKQNLQTCHNWTIYGHIVMEPSVTDIICVVVYITGYHLFSMFVLGKDHCSMLFTDVTYYLGGFIFWSLNSYNSPI